MSSTNDVLRSKHERMIFEVTADAFFAHSESALRRLASSSKKDFVKYWTMYRSLEAEEDSAEKPSRSRGDRAPRERFNVARPLRGPRVGSQAWSKARDSRSLPEGVPRFESWPTHPHSPVFQRSEEVRSHRSHTRLRASVLRIFPPERAHSDVKINP